MKKLLFPLMFISILIAFYEQTKTEKNSYLQIGAIVVFMMCMMLVSAKTPSKNQDKEEDNV